MAKRKVTTSVIGRLASSLGRRDEVPNIELAISISNCKDRNAVAELVALIKTGTKPVRSNAIKVLYEVGVRNPGLISGFVTEFVEASMSSDNRLVWGALAALDEIAGENLKAVYAALDQILNSAEKGSVIAKDHAVNILIKLSLQSEYAVACGKRLLQNLNLSADNQFPMYCERSAEVLSKNKYRAPFVALMNRRIGSLEKLSQRRRIEKLLKRLS